MYFEDAKHPQGKRKERNSHCAYHVYTKANLIGDQDLSTSKALNRGCKLTDLGFSSSIGFLKKFNFAQNFCCWTTFL